MSPVTTAVSDGRDSVSNDRAALSVDSTDWITRSSYLLALRTGYKCKSSTIDLFDHFYIWEYTTFTHDHGFFVDFGQYILTMYIRLVDMIRVSVSVPNSPRQWLLFHVRRPGSTVHLSVFSCATTQSSLPTSETSCLLRSQSHTRDQS